MALKSNSKHKYIKKPEYHEYCSALFVFDPQYVTPLYRPKMMHNSTLEIKIV